MDPEAGEHGVKLPRDSNRIAQYTLFICVHQEQWDTFHRGHKGHKLEGIEVQTICPSSQRVCPL